MTWQQIVSAQVNIGCLKILAEEFCSRAAFSCITTVKKFFYFKRHIVPTSVLTGVVMIFMSQIM